jgi:hypothetical protein
MSIKLTREGSGGYTYRGINATYRIWSENSLYGDKHWYCAVDYGTGTPHRDYHQAETLRTIRWIIADKESQA